MTFVLAICLLTFASDIGDGSELNLSPVQWLNLEQALSKAKSENKPLFIYFRAEWCVYCKKMERTVFREKDIQNYINGQFVPVRINGESDNPLEGIKSNITSKEFRRELDISSYPSFVILSPKGKLITKWTGFSPKSVILSTHKYIQ